MPRRENLNRKKYLYVYFTEKEYNEFLKFYKDEGHKSLSNYARFKLLNNGNSNQKKQLEIESLYIDLMGNFSKIGNNINQIARRLNSGINDKNEIEFIKNEYNKIYEILRELAPEKM